MENIRSFFSNNISAGDMKKRGRIFIRVLSWVIWLALTRGCLYSVFHGETLSIQSGEIVVFTYHLFPYLMLGALYGYLVALGSFTLTFIAALIFTMDDAYKMIIYLVATLCFALFSQYGWFKTLKKTILASIYSLVLISFATMGCLTVLADNIYDIRQMLNIGVYFTRDFFVTLLCGISMHLFFTRVPDICKIVFPLGVGYTKAYQENTEIKRSLRKTRVSIKITAIIVAVEVILGLSVSIFMIALFPDMRNMMFDSINQQSFLKELAGAISENDFQNAIEHMDYKFGDSALGFDIKMILLMLCIGVPMAAFANFYTKITIGGPLGVMSDFMYEFANADDDKKLEVGRKVDRIQVKTHDEIEVVHEAMRSTVYSIEDYITRLKAEQELETQLEVAQKASEAKSSFLSNMSHEIRTPINAVLGMNEMILRESSEEQILEYAQNVKSAGSSLLSIINDILDYNKIEAGKMDILPVEYNLGSTINDLLNMIYTKAQDKGLALEINVDETLPTTLFGDEVRIKQCVTNVLTNAVKYTEDGSVTMNVSYRKLDDENISLKFQVVDTGIGIKEEDLSKLFSPFERIEEIRNRTIEGTGLGMSIVKKLLAMMDTKLVVKSVYGEGSDFSFEVEQKVLSWEELGDFKEKYKEYLKSLTKYHEKFRAPDAEILVVDDTVMNLTVVRGLLKSTQIKIDTAESGMETLDKVTKKKYDAIFIDHRMPEMDGLETLAAMKTLEGNLNVGVPCIALTANAGANARDEYLAAGFDDYLSKPVNGEIMEDMLKEYLPKEKIVEVSDADTKSSAAEGSSQNGTDAEPKDFLDKLEGIDLNEAVKNCGSRDVLKDVAKEFLISIDAKADNIERYAEEKDFRNYTVLVHALKSSARLIGAMKLSEMAAYLEKCGNDENADEIAQKTPELLSLYRSYKDKLSAADEKSGAELPEIDKEELEGAFSDMKELIDAYDYDTADGIMKMLSDYSVPKEYEEKYAKVKELMAAVDRDGLLEIL